MPFPNFDYCLICEGVRPELGGKLTILGYYGAAPNVEVVVNNPGHPVMLAIIAGFPPVGGPPAQYTHATTVIRPNNSVAFQSPQSPLGVNPTGRGIVVVGFVIAPPYVWGKHSIRITVNNETKLDTSFTLRQPGPAEMAAMGGLPFSMPPGKPN